jgi:peptidoglycan/LPS O-acetylase OafA/YrhL
MKTVDRAQVLHGRIDDRTPSGRRHDLDWLRVLAVLALIPFHSARVFDAFDNFYVKNPVKNGPLSWGVIAFLSPWHMPLLFVLAGAATWFALEHRSARGYAVERIKRLLIPFLFGLLIIVPPQTYLARWLRGRPVSLGSYWTLKGDLSGYTGNWTPAHLWFIAFLLVFSLLALPLFVRWRRRVPGARWLLVAMPLVLVIANELPSPNDGPQNPWYSFALFVGGFLLVADERTERLVHRAWRPLLVVAILTMATAMVVWHTGANDRWADKSALDIGFSILEQVNVWVWVLGLLGVGHALLNREHRVLRYANQAAYPFYLLHQTVIVAVAYVVVHWSLGVWPKFAIIVVTSLALTVAIYEFVVRRTRLTRFLFGMKPSGAPLLDRRVVKGLSPAGPGGPSRVPSAAPSIEQATAR